MLASPSARRFDMRFAGFAVIAMTIALQAASRVPHAVFGTWKLDLARSTFSPGPAPRGQTLTNERWKDGMRAVIELADADGKTRKLTVEARFDKQSYPIGA